MKRWNSKRLAFTLIATVAFWPSGAFGMVIVFDLTNLVQLVQQAAQQVQLVEQSRQQIQNQLAMLRSWDYSQLDGILRSMEVWQEIFDRAGTIYSSADPGTALGERYPLDPGDYAGISDKAVRAMRDRWDQEQRSVLIENRTVQNNVYLDLAPTARRIGQYVERSNAAPGATAAVQAGNEELATLVAQLQTLQSQEITDARGEVERNAQEQAEQAYAEQQRQAVRGDWNTPQPPSTSLVNAFPAANQ